MSNNVLMALFIFIEASFVMIKLTKATIESASVIGQSNIDCLLTYLDPHIYLLDVRLAILAYCLSVPLRALHMAQC